MNITLLLTFIGLNIANVVIQTVKSLCTVKGGKWTAALVNAIAYGLYTIVLIYMVCDLSTWLKAVVVGLCNLVGVYVVKLIEEKTRKDKLWKIECTVKDEFVNDFSSCLLAANISYNFIESMNEIDTIFNIYSNTQKESTAIKEIAKNFNAKYFVSESKTL